MKKWTAVAFALMVAVGVVTTPTSAVAQPAVGDPLAGVWVLRAANGSALVERGGTIGLGSSARATRWRFVPTGSGEGGAEYVIHTKDLRGWVLPRVAPSAPVKVQPLLALPTDTRNQRWRVYLDAGAAQAGVRQVTIASAVNGWPVVVTGDYLPHLAVVPETFAPVTYRAIKVGN
ncbi:hypothetical protein [Actinokineospora cianjurensis]|uniref:Ricin-type beta-trefoil lectin protein n=1 Tax=Actinokineospora cianjurensis TaxID=585224 RepID=A0A421B1E8_9PSEU|nr:hypothetical protein [Actinokineospora cianjurensis]RLK58214.1 hypothetical protein CLV68_4308 [Actinokineospora cianjurensis]